MKRILTTILTLGLMASMAVSASAADYSFDTSGDTNYYKSTNYEDRYDGQYNYGGSNQIDFDIPEVEYGLAQEFLEASLDNPYLSSGIQYGIQPSPDTTYPTVSYGDPVISTGTLVNVPYTPAVTVDQLKQSDGSLGTVSIARIGLKAKVYEGATSSSMAKGAGHYSTSSCWTGNVTLFGHNRGNGVAYFANLKNAKVGDIVTYTTNQGTKTYEVKTVCTISYTDYSYLNEMGDNRITLITCIANQPSLRLCVQAVEIQ